MSLGGDSDTLACITGGIAEAYYREIPAFMVEKTAALFPEVFRELLSDFREKTPYGKLIV